MEIMMMMILRCLTIINFVKIPVKPFAFASVRNAAPRTSVVQADFLPTRILYSIVVVYMKIFLSNTSPVPIYKIVLLTRQPCLKISGLT